MTTRTRERTVRFRHSFTLKNADRPLLPGEYCVVSDEESIDGLSFMAYRTTSLSMEVPLPRDGVTHVALDRSASIEIVQLSLEELERALEKDRHDGLCVGP